MSECSLSGRDQGHVSNFYIVDLENFAAASRRYTGDITKQRKEKVDMKKQNRLQESLTQSNKKFRMCTGNKI